MSPSTPDADPATPEAGPPPVATPLDDDAGADGDVGGGDESDAGDFAAVGVPDGRAESDTDGFEDLITDEPASLDPRFIPAERVSWWIVTAVLGAASFVGAAITIVTNWPPGLLWLAVPGWIAFTGILLWLTLRWPEIVYRHTSYLVTPVGLEIRRGVFWKSVITLPASRTQHTDVMQGPLQRRFGIATLTAHTAGTTNASVALSGLSREQALCIRDYLIRSTQLDAV